jgi:hypothetical protein
MNSKTIVVGVIALAIIGLAILQFGNKQTPSGGPPAGGSPTQQVEQSVSSTPETLVNFKNGTYTAEGEYISPNGPEHVEVTVTLMDGVITDSQFKSLAQHPTSKKMQGLFAAEYESLIIGKKIDEVDLDVVNGSSLTPKGFEDALQKIEQQAS